MTMFRHKAVVCGPPAIKISDHLSTGKYLFEELRAIESDRPAIIDGDTGAVLTYGSLLRQSVKVAASLGRLGISRGSIVTVCSENRFEAAIADMAIISIGATITNVNMAYREDEMRHTLSITKPEYVFCSPDSLKLHRETWTSLGFMKMYFVFGSLPLGLPGLTFNELQSGDVDISLFDPAEVNGTEDLVMINYSSGTTGMPKGVMITHLSMMSLLAIYHKFELKEGDGENRVLSVLPWSHAFGFCTLFIYLCARRTLVFVRRFDPETYLSCIEKYKIHTIVAVPTMLVRLMKVPTIENYNLQSCKEIFSGAAPLALEAKLQLKKWFGSDVYIYQGYGLTESTMGVMRDTDPPDDNSTRTGKLLPGVRAKVIDVNTGEILGPHQKGELYFKGTVMMKGYLCKEGNPPDAFDEEGFLKTGDVGYYDENGFFYVLDRIKDLIKYKGFQVPPAEVESILLQHNGILECAVVGKPDEVAGELPTAFIVLKPGVAVSKEEIASFVATRLSSPKWLRGGVNFVDSLPKNSTGKIMKSRIRAL